MVLGSVDHWPWSQPRTCFAASAIDSSSWSVSSRTSGESVPVFSPSGRSISTTHRTTLRIEWPSVFAATHSIAGDELLGLTAPEAIRRAVVTSGTGKQLRGGERSGQ